MALSRRALLRGLGGVAATAVAARVGLATLARGPFSEPARAQGGQQEAERQWAMVIDMRRCDGCKYCTEACQATHYLPKDQEWIKVYEVADGEGNTYFMPRPCMQCENAPCLKVCPVAATFKNEQGVILVDQDRCIGCRACMAACPYGARYFNFWDPPKPPGNVPDPMPEFPVPQQRGTVGKCVLCVHYANEGRLPACVDACHMDAIYMADLNSDVMTNRSGETYKLSQYLHENDAFRYKEDLNTSPRVWYIAGHGQALGGRRWR